MEKIKEIEVKDIWLASYLKTKGYEMVGIKRDGNFAIFIFMMDEVKYEEEIKLYMTDKGFVSAKAYKENFIMLKHKIYSK
ncbi:MAG TPA: DUF5659 domain-containing protein [Victivallales bacterium]|nr:DUF5659 domain-containing protein [Victivallales bacterium]